MRRNRLSARGGRLAVEPRLNQRPLLLRQRAQLRHQGRIRSRRHVVPGVRGQVVPVGDTIIAQSRTRSPSLRQAGQVCPPVNPKPQPGLKGFKVLARRHLAAYFRRAVGAFGAVKLRGGLEAVHGHDADPRCRGQCGGVELAERPEGRRGQGAQCRLVLTVPAHDTRRPFRPDYGDGAVPIETIDPDSKRQLTRALKTDRSQSRRNPLIQRGRQRVSRLRRSRRRCLRRARLRASVRPNSAWWRSTSSASV